VQLAPIERARAFAHPLHLLIDHPAAPPGERGAVSKTDSCTAADDRTHGARGVDSRSRIAHFIGKRPGALAIAFHGFSLPNIGAAVGNGREAGMYPSPARRTAAPGCPPRGPRSAAGRRSSRNATPSGVLNPDVRAFASPAEDAQARRGAEITGGVAASPYRS